MLFFNSFRNAPLNDLGLPGFCSDEVDGAVRDRIHEVMNWLNFHYLVP